MSSDVRHKNIFAKIEWTLYLVCSETGIFIHIVHPQEFSFHALTQVNGRGACVQILSVGCMKEIGRTSQFLAKGLIVSPQEHNHTHGYHLSLSSLIIIGLLIWLGEPAVPATSVTAGGGRIGFYVSIKLFRVNTTILDVLHKQNGNVWHSSTTFINSFHFPCFTPSHLPLL